MILIIKSAVATPEQDRYLAASTASGFPVVLQEDGVYQAAALSNTNVSFSVREYDAHQRGVKLEGICMLSDAQLIWLTEQHGKQVILR